jgi:thiol-disulfide isomerase/thioredoxin
MRALCSVLLLVVLPFSATGCAIFGKKEGSGERHGGFAWFKKKDSATNPPPPKFPDPLTAPGTVPPPTSSPTAQSGSAAEALLAGRVVDAYNRPANNSYVRLVQLDSAKDGGAPIDVATSADGYFIIPGLKTGSQYQLIARTKQGDKLLAGITIRQAPDPHVVIQVKEEFATSSIPPLPDNSDKREEKPATTSALENRTPTPAVWTPTPQGSNSALAGQGSTPGEVDIPAKLTVPTPVSPSTSGSTPGTLAPGVASAPNTWPPTLQIAPGRPSPAPARPSVPPQPPSLPASDLPTTLAPLVPSCVIVGSKAQILAFKDVDDQTWNFHKDRRGKVVLLDFWIPNCLPCRTTMPILMQMQNKYRPQGLEVVGVVIDSGPVRDQAERAKKQCFSLQATYRQVLGQDEKTRLREQFHLQNYPTLILVDATGHELWRHEGVPDQAVLEQVLQKNLANRAF